MGPRLGKFIYYSYNMSDRSERKPKCQEDNNVEATSSSKSNSKLSKEPSSCDETSTHSCSHEKEQSDDQSDGKSSTGSGETTCTSWRTRSENWSKKRRTFKGTTSAKKDFFGKRNKKWPMRKGKGEPSDVESPPTGSMSCVCTMYRRTNSETEPIAGPSGVTGNDTIQNMFSTSTSNAAVVGQSAPIIDLSKFNPADYPIDDEDERMRQERAKEMQEGVELSSLLGGVSLRDNSYPAHSQVDFIHYLVPDLKEITNCSFYWGKIDRYEAEKLLEGKPEGTFLLRDSAQEEYLFSVSFRRYGRSLHARIEQWNNQFSFDSHDPSVYSSTTVTGLIEHYKDPSCCMFFEPMLTTPLHRNFPFGLQHLSRATICSNLKYDSINSLPLPKSLNMYLKEYHYKQRVRVRRLE